MCYTPCFQTKTGVHNTTSLKQISVGALQHQRCTPIFHNQWRRHDHHYISRGGGYRRSMTSREHLPQSPALSTYNGDVREVVEPSGTGPGFWYHQYTFLFQKMKFRMKSSSRAQLTGRSLPMHARAQPLLPPTRRRVQGQCCPLKTRCAW